MRRRRVAKKRVVLVVGSKILPIFFLRLLLPRFSERVGDGDKAFLEKKCRQLCIGFLCVSNYLILIVSVYFILYNIIYFSYNINNFMLNSQNYSSFFFFSKKTILNFFFKKIKIQNWN